LLVDEALPRRGNGFKARESERPDQRHTDFDTHEKVDEPARMERDEPAVLVRQQEEQDEREAADEAEGHSAQEPAPDHVVPGRQHDSLFLFLRASIFH
jgi:hypothetical protein